MGEREPRDDRTGFLTNRRRFLIATGTAGVAGFAGCQTGDGGDGDGTDGDTTTTTTTTEGGDGGDGNDTDDGDGSDGEVNVVDQTFQAHMWTNPTNVQFNPYSQTNTSGHLFDLLYDELARYSPDETTFRKFAATDWTVESQQFTVTLREGMTWHNGDPVTAQDVVTKWKLDKFMQLPIADFVDSIETLDERRARANLQQTTNPEVLKHTLLPTVLNAPHALFEEKVTAFEEAGSEDERDNVRSDMLEFAVSPDDQYGNGPFVLQDTNTQFAESTRFEDYYWADRINFSTVRNNFRTSNQQNWQAIKGGNQDLSWTAMPKSVRQSLPDHVQRYLYPPFFGGGIQFQHDDPVFGNRKIRKAVTYVVDRPKVGENAGGYYPVEVPSGIGGVSLDTPEEWLGDLHSSFNTYGPADTEAAAQLMREVDYQKQNGTWQKDGEPLSASFKVPAGYSDWVKAVQTIVGNLKSFGLDIEMQTVEVSSYWGSMFPNGEFRLCANGWGQGPYPYYSFNQLFNTSSAETAYNYPEEVELPPVGEPDSDETETFAPRDLTQELARTTDESKATEIVRRLAWTVNQDLVMAPIWDQYGHYFVAGDDWNIPPQDDPDTSTGLGVYWMMRQGDVAAKSN